MSSVFPACDPKVRDALRKKHWPKGMGFLPEHDALIARGWPHLALLVDGDPRDKKPADTARKYLEAIDPPFAVHWPRAASVHFLNAFATVEHFANSVPVPGEYDRSTPITVALADSILGRAKESLEFYPFHWEAACFLLEAHLGAEVMADRVLTLLEKLKKSTWDFFNPHDRMLEVVFALELFILRSGPKAAAASCDRLRALLAKAKPAAMSLLGIRLAMTLKGTSAYVKNRRAFVYNVPFLTADEGFVPDYLDHEYSTWLLEPQLLAIAGPKIADEETVAGMRRDASWKQVQRTLVFGIIRHPVIVEIFAAMVGSKGAKGRPELWLAEHLAFARPTLQKLIAAGHPRAAELKELLAAGPAAGKVAEAKVKASKTLTEKQLDAGVAKILRKVVADIRKVRGVAKKEAALWKKAAIEVMELRAAAGHIAPEERLGHLFGVDGWGEIDAPFQTLKATYEEIDRWIEVINEA